MTVIWKHLEVYGNTIEMDHDGVNIDVPGHPNSVSFKYKQKITGQTGNNGTEDV